MSSEDPVTLVQAVRDAGGTVVREPREAGFGVVAFVQDPDGTAIEIMGQ